jgi:hypothetical protein
MKNTVRAAAGLLLLCATVLADTRRETPVGLMLIPGGSSIIPAHSETSPTAKAGEILFAPGQINFRGGKLIEQKPIQSCFLPSVVHVATASQQHYGVSMVRGINTAEDLKPVPRDKLDPAVVRLKLRFGEFEARSPRRRAKISVTAGTQPVWRSVRQTTKR